MEVFHGFKTLQCLKELGTKYDYGYTKTEDKDTKCTLDIRLRLGEQNIPKVQCLLHIFFSF